MAGKNVETVMRENEELYFFLTMIHYWDSFTKSFKNL